MPTAEELLDQTFLELNKEFNVDGPFKLGEKQGAHNLQELLNLLNDNEFKIPSVLRNSDAIQSLFDADIDPILLPAFSDSFSTALPLDAWDWQSTEYNSAAVEVQVDSSAMKLLEQRLTQDKRGSIIWNLFETEQNYFKQLTILQNYFYRKLLEKRVISEHSANLIFGGIKDLCDFHLMFYTKMESILKEWDSAQTGIGSLFVEHCDDLTEIYNSFIDNYAISQKCIKKEEKEVEWINFTKEAAKDPETQRQGLKDYLITPVQRTTRYHLILKDLLKATPKEHSDYENLHEAHKTMEGLANSVNDKKRKEEEATGLFEAYESTKHCPPTLIAHRRRLVLTADALCPKSNRPIRLTICSDLLMISIILHKTVLPTFFAAPATEYQYRFIRWIDLLELEIEDLNSQKPNQIRLSYNPTAASAKRASYSTQSNEIASMAKELGTCSFLLQFTGYDESKTIKNREVFVKALETVIHSVRKEEES